MPTSELPKVMHFTIRKPTAQFLEIALAFASAALATDIPNSERALRQILGFAERARPEDVTEINQFLATFSKASRQAFDLRSQIFIDGVGIINPDENCPHCAHGSGEACCFCGKVIP